MLGYDFTESFLVPSNFSVVPLLEAVRVGADSIADAGAFTDEPYLSNWSFTIPGEIDYHLHVPH